MKNRSEDWTERQIPEGGRALSVYLKRKAPELATSYAEVYLSQKNPEERAKALEAFFVCPYPLDPTPIMKDAESDCHSLRSAAIEVLGEIRNQKVREYALGHIKRDIRKNEGKGMVAGKVAYSKASLADLHFEM